MDITTCQFTVCIGGSRFDDRRRGYVLLSFLLIAFADRKVLFDAAQLKVSRYHFLVNNGVISRIPCRKASVQAEIRFCKRFIHRQRRACSLRIIKPAEEGVFVVVQIFIDRSAVVNGGVVIVIKRYVSYAVIIIYRLQGH